MSDKPLIDAFHEYEIVYELHTHVPIFTAEEAHKLHYKIKGAHTKNLFLRDKKKNFFLVSILEDKRVDLKTLSTQFGAGHFSFGNADELLSMLGVIPGSVTPYGLIHDKDEKVKFLLDKDVMGYEYVNFHPLRNDMTVNMALKEFLRFIEKLGRSPEIITIPTI